MPISLPKIGGVLLGLVASGYLLNDALTYSLAPADPVSGRARGCYTVVERMLGGLEPNDPLRQGQLYVAIVGILVAGLYALAVAFKRERR